MGRYALIIIGLTFVITLQGSQHNGLESAKTIEVGVQVELLTDKTTQPTHNLSDSGAIKRRVTDEDLHVFHKVLKELNEAVPQRTNQFDWEFLKEQLQSSCEIDVAGRNYIESELSDEDALLKRNSWAFGLIVITRLSNPNNQ